MSGTAKTKSKNLISNESDTNFPIIEVKQKSYLVNNEKF